MDELPRTIGTLEAKIERLEKDVAHLVARQEEMLEILHQAKGGWKVFMAVAGASAAVGAVMTKVTSWVMMR